MAHYSFLLFFLLVIFSAACPANAQTPSTQATRSPFPESLPSKQGLDFSVGPRGLDSLWYNGQPFLLSPESGELQPWKSAFRAGLDLLFPLTSSSIPAPAKRPDTVDLIYPWGRVSCTYGKHGDKITMRIEAFNTSSKPLNEFSVRLMELSFPRVPDGGTLEAGMFGFGFKGPEWQIHRGPDSIPSVADPRFVVPIVRVDYGTGALNFCSDDVECAVNVPSWTNSATGTSYPFIINCLDIKPGISKSFNVSFRFGPAG